MRARTFGLGVIVAVVAGAIGACASDSAPSSTGDDDDNGSGGSGNVGNEGGSGGGTGGVGGLCSDVEDTPCSAPIDCCDPLHCTNEGDGFKCHAECSAFNTPCTGTDQGSCCSPFLLCDPSTLICIPQPCDSTTTDCDADGWLVAEGDCCDKPGVCGSEPEKVNPGALEVEGNALDDNCNGKVDLFDTEDTVDCDTGLPSDSANPIEFAKAMGICKLTVENPPDKKDKTWGLIDAKILMADGNALANAEAHSIRAGFGSVAPNTTEGDSIVVLSSGIASDATQTLPGPNGGPGDGNVSNSHGGVGTSALIASPSLPYSVGDWYQAPNPPLKPANGLPDSPGCNASNDSDAQDSVMLVLRMRAPTNAKAFSFNSYFFSAEYPEFVCTSFNDQYIALVDTPNGTPAPIPNPVDKNLMTYSDGMQKWPIGINIAKGTSLFSVCETQTTNPSCWDTDVSATSCGLGSAQLTGTGFETGTFDSCTIGGGTFWLTTAGNVIPGDIVEVRIAIWDVGDSAYDSTALIDGFKWLANATLPGTN